LSDLPLFAPSFLRGPGPRWFNIPAHRPFVRDLAQGLYDALQGDGPQALSQAIVLTPTRRGAAPWPTPSSA
jgi:ATP-dependent helicase/nuclease subunit B